jgi:hypothetical protein
VASKEKDVLRLEVAVDDLRLEVGQGITDVFHHIDRFREAEAIARRGDEVPERPLCAGHDKHPRVTVFAMLKNRDYVSDVAEVNE